MHEFTHDNRPFRYDADRDKVQEKRGDEWVDVKDADLREALFRLLNDGYGPDGD